MSYFFVICFKIFSNLHYFPLWPIGYLYVYGLNSTALGILKIFSYLIVIHLYLLFMFSRSLWSLSILNDLNLLTAFEICFEAILVNVHLKRTNPAIVRCSILHITKLHWKIMLLNSPTFLLIFCLLVYLFYWLPQERYLKVNTPEFMYFFLVLSILASYIL